MTGTPTKMTMGRSRIREKGPGLGGQCQMQHPRAVVGPGGAPPLGSPRSTATAATAWPPPPRRARPGSDLGFSGGATAPACCSPSVFNDDPRSYRFLHNPLLGPLPHRPPPHPRRSPSPCVSGPCARTGRSLLFCMSLFLTSPAAPPQFPASSHRVFSSCCSLASGWGGVPLPAPLGRALAAGGLGSGTGRGAGGRLGAPLVPSLHSPIEDTAAFSVLISVR